MPRRTPYLKNLNATNSTRARFFCEEHLCLCAHSWLGVLPSVGDSKARERVVMKNQFTARENDRMCVNTHTKKKREVWTELNSGMHPFRL